MGTSLCETLRIGRLIERHDERFLNRIYSPAEIIACRERTEYLQHFTMYWAIKDATVRAIGPYAGPGLSWREVLVQEDGSFRHEIVLRGELALVAARLKIGPLMVSAAHCRTMATAHVIALREGA
ncbi:MAG: hypothetical protein C0478_07405 [Planctomyces sp.]|jgi:holo-[acyl-carrier protein] synthase|nr:hypothetical protein [Planctomyces sp.]